MAHPDDRFNNALAAFDAYHSKDPVVEEVQGQSVPRELLYATRMTDRLNAFAPGAPEVLRLSARCQHIGRWEIPRSAYPMDRKGYLQWRNAEKAHHARLAGDILAQCGYAQEVIDRVTHLVLKKQLHHDAETQLLEDVACLVFIEHYLADFASQHPREKVIDILQKTLKKMSRRARENVALLHLAPAVREMLADAASPAGS